MNLSPLPIQKFFDNNGRPLVGGLLFTYTAGTTTKIATYKDQAGTPNTNPIVLDYRGEANVWLDPTLTYKFVLAPEGDTDPPTKPIWTVDNISAAITFASLTQIIIGQILYPRSAAEIAAGVTPINIWLPYGWITRYGTNTTPGTTDMASALSAAAAQGAQTGSSGAASVFLPKGNFLIASEVVLPDATVIRGSGMQNSILRMSTAISAGSALLRLSTFNRGVTFEDFQILIPAANVGKANRGIRMAETRGARISRIAIYGIGTVSDDTIAILFDGSGTFTGEGTLISDCLFSNHLRGVDLQGTCTDVQITNSTFFGTSGHGSSRGVNVTPACDGVVIEGNSFDLNFRGVYTEGTNTKIDDNRFECTAPAAPYQLVRGAGNARIWGLCISNSFTGTGTPIFPYNDIDANMIFDGPGYGYVDTMAFNSMRGFIESGRTLRMGAFTTQTFAAGDYTAQAGTWTVAIGDVNTNQYAQVGQILFWNLQVQTTDVSVAPTYLQTTIPAGFAGSKKVTYKVYAQDNGTLTDAFGVIDPAVGSGTVMRIFKMVGAWTASAGATVIAFNVSLEIN